MEIDVKKTYIQEKFEGERALFHSGNLELVNCTFMNGESPLKESHDLDIKKSLFQWKYPLWYCKNVSVTDSTMYEMARAGIWYTDNIYMKNITYNAPKGFRRCNNLEIENIVIPDASETLWNCNEVKIKNMIAKGDYFAMGISNAEFDGLTLTGNYSFDGGKNIVVRNSKLLSKDAFWNCENVTVYDSFVSGEYFGWNAKNVTLINCTIESEQGMCYMDNIVMKECKLINTNLAFEYSTVDAEIENTIDSVKNPISGKITAAKIDEIIFDATDVDSKNTVIVQTAKSEK